MNHDNDCNVTPNWGPKIGGVATFAPESGRAYDNSPEYRAVYEAGRLIPKGTLVEVTIPGMRPFTTVTVRDGAWVDIMGNRVPLTDRSNGINGSPGQMWSFRAEVTVPSRVQALEALPKGTMFFISPESVTNRSVYLRTAQGVTNVTEGRDLVIDERNFGHANAANGFPYIIGRLESAS